MDAITVDGALTLVRNEDRGDWYTIERAEHARVCSVGSGSYWYSGRISDSDVEGPAREMLAIAVAIAERAAVEFRRCAVHVYPASGIASLWSPRSSTRVAVVPLAVADDLAREIQVVLGRGVSGC